jgi:predicted dehydrogenase/threonine dehydrogenase-like Zn-dependent dehydrogenase
MKQLLQKSRDGALSLDEVPAPQTRADGILVVTHNSLISAGTERASAQIARKNLLGKAMDRPDLVRKVWQQVQKQGLLRTAQLVSNRLDAPTAPGYSCAGVVLEVGAAVSGLKVGDRVACAGQNYASHAELVCVPKNLCVRIPDAVDYEAASYVALGAIAMQGLRQAEPALGEVIVVIGLGLLGQLTVQMLAANGCRVVGADPDAQRVALARASGVDAVGPSELAAHVMHASGGRGADAAIITASARDDGPIAAAADLCRKRGRVVVVGAVGMNLPREPFYMKEIDLRLSTSYGPGRYDVDYEEKGHDYPYAYVRWTEQRNMQAFLELLRDGRVKAGALTTHRFPIERAAEAYDLILNDSEPHLGVLLEYTRPVEARRAPRVVLREAPVAAAAQVRLGVIGAGNHVNDVLLPLLAARDDLTLRAICTATGIKARSLADKWSAAYCSSDPGTILADPEVNAVLIGTRHDSHARLVREALAAGKHVFVEKPLCKSEQEIAATLASCETAVARGLRVMVGFNRRYSEHARAIRAFLAGRTNPLVMSYRVNAGAIDPRHWTQDPEVGGGRIIGEGCHFIDFMQFVSGGVVSAVSAAAIANHDSGVTSDQAVITVEFTDGSVGTLIYAAEGDRALPKERFEAFGDGRAVVLDDFRATELWQRGRRQRVKTRVQDKGFAAEIASFCDSVRGGTTSLPSVNEIASVTWAACLAERALSCRERLSIPTPDAPPVP